MRAVLDASAVVELLRWSPAGQRVARTLVSADADLHVPHLCPVEVTSALRSLVARGEVPEGRARTALEDLADLPATRHPVEPLLPRIWGLRDAITAYDATYVALAEALEATLITGDRKLAAAVAGTLDVALL
jgi:predicted nucleic acid-binding protein